MFRNTLAGNSSLVSFSMLVALVTLLHCHAQEERVEDSESGISVERNDYIVLTAEDTALQQFLEDRDAKRPGTTHLLLDGNTLCTDETLDLDKFDWEQLAEDLAKTTSEPQKGLIQIRSYFAESPGRNARVLRWTLEGFASGKLKFGEVRQTETYGSSLHEGVFAARHANTATNSAHILEDAVGNKYVDVYPVRTFLSRLYTGGADCVVHVKPRFAEDFGGSLPRGVRTSMRIFASKVKFESKKKVMFVFYYSPGKGDEAKKWFFEEGVEEMTAILGFKDWSIQTKYE